MLICKVLSQEPSLKKKSNSSISGFQSCKEIHKIELSIYIKWNNFGTSLKQLGQYETMTKPCFYKESQSSKIATTK